MRAAWVMALALRSSGGNRRRVFGSNCAVHGTVFYVCGLSLFAAGSCWWKCIFDVGLRCVAYSFRCSDCKEARWVDLLFHVDWKAPR